MTSPTPISELANALQTLFPDINVLGARSLCLEVRLTVTYPANPGPQPADPLTVTWELVEGEKL